MLRTSPEPSPALPAPAAEGRSLLQMAGMLLPGTGTCLPCALLFPHLVMTLVCPGVWRVPCPPVCPGTPMLLQERHPPLPPGACSSGMRMGLVLSPGCLVLLSCPFPHPLPLFRPRDEESRAGTGRAQAAAACGDPAFRLLEPKGGLGAEEEPWRLHGTPLPPGRAEQLLQSPSPPALRTVTPCCPQHPSAKAFTLLAG